MNKIEMYKEVPQGFHNALCETLEQLEETKVVKFSTKKFVITCAAAVLAASTLTVGAMELFQWYQTARESLGTNQELENKLTNQGAALPAENADVQQNITVTALQAVKMGDDFYLLAAMDWPEDLEWNDDIVFEGGNINLVKEFKEETVGQGSTQESAEATEKDASMHDFGGFTVNLTDAPDENGMVYVEMIARSMPDVTYTGEAKVTLSNLIQTEKTEYVDTLVEAEWELMFRLPTDADTITFIPVQTLSVNRHELTLENIEINPFGVKLYTDKEQGMHAAYYSNMELAAVLYEDGSRVENYGGLLKTAGATDEAGNFYFNLTLQNAVDIDKVSDLVFKEDGEEFIYGLGASMVEQTIKEGMSAAKNELNAMKNHVGLRLYDLMIQQCESESVTNTEAFEKNVPEVTDLRIIYVRHNYVTFTDNHYIYQWDAACDRAEVIADLTECGFDADNGGKIAMMPGGVVMTVHPTADSDKVYMIEMDTHNMYEAEAETFWPVPRYEDYRNSFFKVADREGLTEGVYAPEGYEAQGSAYVLYSADGSVENLELVDVTKDK